MRLHPGRPDLTDHQDLFDVPAAAGELAVTFLGVATLLVDDGEHALLTDGFFSRPSLARVGLGKVAPDGVAPRGPLGAARLTAAHGRRARA